AAQDVQGIVIRRRHVQIACRAERTVLCSNVPCDDQHSSHHDADAARLKPAGHPWSLSNSRMRLIARTVPVIVSQANLAANGYIAWRCACARWLERSALTRRRYRTVVALLLP